MPKPYTLREALDAVGRKLFPTKWRDNKADASNDADAREPPGLAFSDFFAGTGEDATCVDGEFECNALCQGHTGVLSFTCDAGPCPVAIPAVSEWGVVLTLLLWVTVDTLVLRRDHTGQTATAWSTTAMRVRLPTLVR